MSAALEKRTLHFHPPSRTLRIRRLSERAGWATANRLGDRPQIDFACCEPFQCLGPDDLQAIQELIEAHRHLAYQGPRSTSLRGVKALGEMFNSRALEKIVSEIVGVELSVHPMTLEHAHVNLQANNGNGAFYDRPVDDWHEDYVPFVAVFMIFSSGEGGALRTRGYGRYSLKPGEMLLLQGSHVAHRADRCAADRISVVTSFVPKSLEFTDMTRIKFGALPYSPNEPLALQASQYRSERIKHRARLLARAKNNSRMPDSVQALLYEYERWLESQPQVAGEFTSIIETGSELSTSTVEQTEAANPQVPLS